MSAAMRPSAFTFPRVRCLKVLVSASLLGSTSAIASIILPNHQGEIETRISASITADSNIFATQAATSDVISSANLVINYRRTALYSLDSSLAWNIGRFGQTRGEDFSTPSLNALIRTRWGEQDVSAAINSAKTQDANGLLGQRIERWTHGLNLSWSSELAEKLNLTSRAGYSLHRYELSTLQDLDRWQTSAELSRALTPSLQGVLGMNWERDETAAGGANQDWSYTIGLTRQILPKVRGGIRLGYENRRNATTDLDHRDLTSDVDLTWFATNRFRVSASIVKHTDTSPVGQSLALTMMTLSTRYRIARSLDFTSSLQSSRSRFLDSPERRDATRQLSVGFEYPLTKRLDVALNASTSRNRSTSVESANFVRRTLGLVLTLHW